MSGSDTTGRVIQRMLESPELVSAISTLEPNVLSGVIQRIGLEDSAELVGLMSSNQLTDVLDDDLWLTPDGADDEELDPARFALWLEIMSEAGESFVAERLTRMPEDLVVFAFHGLVIVLSVEEIALTAGVRSPQDMARIEAALAQCPSEEIGEYLVVARRQEGWDAVFSALLALDAQEHDFLVLLLERCAALALDEIEESEGLHEVLTRHQMTALDVRDDRDSRRKRRGFVSKEDADRFLALTRRKTLDEILAAPDEGLFRLYQGDLEPVAPLDPSALEAALFAAGVVADAAPSRRLPSGLEPSAFERAMSDLRDKDPGLYESNTEQMIFLANVILALDPKTSKIEAARSVLAYINDAMAHLDVDDLRNHTPIQLFQVGVRLAAGVN